MPFWRGRFPCDVAAHCVAEVCILIRLKACVFSRVLSLSPLQGLQPWQFPQNTGSKEELLLTPLYGELHFHTFPRICWRSSKRRKVRARVVVDRPRLCRASSVDANVEGLKNSNTHQRIAKAIFFSFDAPSQELWSIKKLPFTIFVVHATTWKCLSLYSRRLCGFQSSCHAACYLVAEASVTGRGRAAAWSISKEVFFFFFWYFRKKLRARATRNKENNNSGLSQVLCFHYCKFYTVLSRCVGGGSGSNPTFDLWPLTFTL